MHDSSARALKLRLMLLAFAWYVPLLFALVLGANAHGVFLHLDPSLALPTLTADFALPVLGVVPGHVHDLDASRPLLFYAFWGALAIGPGLCAAMIARQHERARLVEVALQGALAYGVFAATLFLALLGGLALPFL